MNNEENPVETQKAAEREKVASYIRAMGGIEMLAGVALGFNLGGITDTLLNQPGDLISGIIGGALFFGGAMSYFVMPKLLTKKPPSSAQ